MITSIDQQLLKEVLEIDWEIEVRRPGFIQSKMIVLEAELQPLPITPNVTLGYDTALWARDVNTYRKDRLNNFPNLYTQAFAEDQNWPLTFIEKCSLHAQKLANFLGKRDQDWKKGRVEELSQTFKTYIDLLMEIQHFYVTALHLANFCEQKIGESAPDLLEYATPYQRLDVDELQNSLAYLHALSQEGDEQLDESIQQHIRRFSWIKTAYNILSPYTEEEVRQEIAEATESELSIAQPKNTPYLLQGLRIGVYLRNRIKEASQQLWWGVEPVAQALAEYLGITRDQFFNLLHQEVFLALETGRMPVSSEEFEERAKGFVGGFLGGKELFATGEVVDIIEKAFLAIRPEEQQAAQLQGQIACRGKVTGRVRIILNHSDFSRLEKGDILVTAMTTPDFVPLMKRAAAIVTNEGGLASHAAVISRELKVPCVIGTKIATDILKDGEMIEVNADEGLITRL